MTHQRADVLIVGAGLGGAVAALTLAKAGVSVVCLEQGEWPDPAAYPGDKPTWELLARTAWSPDPAVRRSPADYPVTLADSPVRPLLYNAVGGSTILYAGQWFRMLPSDFRARSLDGVADDWPIGWRDLWPHYDAVDEEMGVSGVPGDPAVPPTGSMLLPPLPVGRAAGRVIQGMHRLGWHWWPCPNAILSSPTRDRRACVQRGTCESGCNEGAKGSTDRTHWPQAVALGARVVTGARVDRIHVSPAGLVTGASYVDRAGERHFQAAAVTMLAANGIGTPRLLLASATSRYPDGLANSSGLVGRRLMFHTRAKVEGIFDDNLRSSRGHYGGLIHSFQFYASDPARGFVRGAKWAMVPSGGPVGLALRIARTGTWGEPLQARIREQFDHTATWGIVGEDLPSETNTVTLDPDVTDADGIPAPRITYTVGANTQRLIDFHVERAAESLSAAGAREIAIDRTAALSAHLMGTTRMGADPTTSVVDAEGRSHDHRNLYVVDGSVFVTSGGVNPGATIAALARRTAGLLVDSRRNQPVPA